MVLADANEPARLQPGFPSRMRSMAARGSFLGTAPRILVTVAAATATLAFAACSSESEAPSTTTLTVPPQSEATPPPPAAAEDGSAPEKPPRAEEPTTPAEGPHGDPRETALERSAERTVMRFVDALDAGDGRAACALLAEGVIEQIELPRQGRDCATSLAASIGYRDPRGLPVWESAKVATIVSVRLDGERATVVATVVTRFADREEVSIEDDVVYLIRDADSWSIAKPSSTLYRAVGISDVPPSVLTPPLDE